MANKYRLIFIQGPPGTGKTETVAEIVALGKLKYERIGVFAQSNVGVDTALQRCELKEACRIGLSQSMELHDICTGQIVNDRLSKEYPEHNRASKNKL